MKVKCPYCKQEYDLTSEEILGIGHQNVECANCQKTFSLEEVIKNLDTFLEIPRLEQELQKMLEEKDYLANHPDVDARDDERYWTLDRVIEGCDDLRDDIKTARENWNEEKRGNYHINNEDYAVEIVKLIEKGLASDVLRPNDKLKLMRTSKMNNLDIEDIQLWMIKNTPYIFVPNIRELIRLIHESPNMPAPPRSLWSMHGDATKRQIDYLHDLGYCNLPDGIGKKEASWLISAAKHENDELRSIWIDLLFDARNVFDECVDAFSSCNP